MGGFSSINRPAINHGSSNFPEEEEAIVHASNRGEDRTRMRPRSSILEALSPRGSSPEDGDAYSPGNRMAPRIGPGPKNVEILQTRGYHALLMKAYKSGQAPTKLYDGAFLRDLVKAENARNGSLDLAVCSVGENPALRDWGIHDAMKKALLRPDEPHSCVLTDDHSHAAAISMRVLGKPNPTTLSIVVLDSIKPDDLSQVKLHKTLLSEIGKSLDDAALKHLRIQVTILPMGVQVSNEGCNIFALVAAKKAAKSQSVQDLHEWGHDMVGHAAPGIHTQSIPLEPEMLLEPEFFKHAMKRNVIQNVVDAGETLGLAKEVPVNRKGQTLLERFEKFERATIVKTLDREIHTRYSRSYEEKRLDKLARLIEHKQALLAERKA
ncbi:hypothetical protein D0T25_24005 [Duganella sp. BJB488]|nr:hypothetical protein D0T26_23615 [Duganella sp. BJB489]RFP17150.1 hypothetical protein D0T25_24005 [Duganella sp. BJB488]RFP31631.1 hypothetical protein D0T24_24710 [Duganella sp. BJB480]